MKKMDQFRRVAAKKSFGDIEGQSIDSKSAEMVLELYERLSDEHKKQLVSYLPGTMVKLAVSLLE